MLWAETVTLAQRGRRVPGSQHVPKSHRVPGNRRVPGIRIEKEINVARKPKFGSGEVSSFLRRETRVFVTVYGTCTIPRRRGTVWVAKKTSAAVRTEALLES